MFGNNKFGENNIQGRIQKRFHSEGLAGKRRADPQLHATSRPYHTSTAGIHMSVGMTRQVAEQAGPRAVQYLNAMSLSQLAQKKRGLSHDQANGNKMGMDNIRALKGRVASQVKNSAPGNDTVARWQQSLTDQMGALEQSAGGPITPASESHFIRQHNAISGSIGRVKKMKPRKYF